MVDVSEAGENSLLVHDASHAQASLAFALSRITFETHGAVPLGVFRSVDRPVYDDLMSEQLAEAREPSGDGELEALLHSGDTWTVSYPERHARTSLTDISIDISFRDMESLSGTAYVILGMLGLGARTGYDIKGVVDRSTRFFWAASYGQIYPELRRLEKAGLVDGKSSPSGARKRKEYRLTEGGRAELVRWLEAPPQMPELRDESLLKLFFADMLPLEQALEQLRLRRAATSSSLRSCERSLPGRVTIHRSSTSCFVTASRTGSSTSRGARSRRRGSATTAQEAA